MVVSLFHGCDEILRVFDVYQPDVSYFICNAPLFHSILLVDNNRLYSLSRK